MSTYVGKLFTSISSALEFNTATLSGAIDIVVIEDDTGRRQCSPFHVRFGKLQLLKSRGIPVIVELNGCRTSLLMFLGAAGEAYFYRPSKVESPSESEHASQPVLAESSPLSVSSTTPDAVLSEAMDKHMKISVPFDLFDNTLSSRSHNGSHDSSADMGTSPELGVPHHDVATPHLPADYAFAYVSDSEVELTRNERDGTTEVVDEPRSPPLNTSQRKWSTVMATSHDAASHLETHFVKPTSKGRSGMPQCASSSIDRFSSDEIPTSGEPSDDVESMPKDDPSSPSAYEESGERVPFEAPMTVPRSMTDIVGEEDTKMECRSIDEQDEADRLQEMKIQVAGVFSQPSQLAVSSESGDKNGLDLPSESTGCEVGEDHQSVLRMQFHENLDVSVDENEKVSRKDAALAMSMCGRLLSPGMREDQIMELFERHQVSFSDFKRHPALLFDPSVIVKVDNRLVEFRIAAAFLFSVLSFNEKVDIDAFAQLLAEEQKDEPVKSPPTPSRRFRWFGWSSNTVEGEPLLQQDDLDVLDTIPVQRSSKASLDHPKTDTERESSSPTEDNGQMETAVSRIVREKVKDVMEVRDQAGRDQAGTAPRVDAQTDSADHQGPFEIGDSAGVCFSNLDPESLSLRPSEEELMRLDLKPGANSVRFIVESSSVELSCRIFLWNCHSKIVISDVDGTITRSDVLGHLLPAVGRDWSQVGVAGLYTQIEKNGYKILYLTARPIGQASQTRSFLHSVTQGSAKLPNGPVLMSPNRLVESFTREVIHRKPHEFKITALRDIRSLFPPFYNPFQAGFGNRDSDVISYKAVGLIPQRIFVVNPKGELVVTKARYESTASYSTLRDLVESVFPDISRQSGLDKVQAVTESASFNDWNFWKDMLPAVDLDSLLQREP